MNDLFSYVLFTYIIIRYTCCFCIISHPSSRVIINGFGICYMLNVCVCVVPLSHPSSRVIINGFGICYMLNVCVCVVPLSHPSSSDH